MSKHYELNKVGNDWELKRGTHSIYIARLSTEVYVGPQFRKEQCGVAFRYMDLRKDNPENSIDLTLHVIDPELENIEQSLVTLTKKMLTQVELGTFGLIESFSDVRVEFLQYILKYLGEDPNTHLGKETQIPIDVGGDKLWTIVEPDYFYTATRSYNNGNSLYVTTVKRENRKYEHGKANMKYMTSCVSSPKADILTLEAVKDMFRLK